MVYTITFNPSIDYVMNLDSFDVGMVNRSSAEKVLPGGKGINVSVVLNNLGIETTALGFIAGFTGDEIQNRLKQMGCNTDFVVLDNGISRINVKLKSDVESEINGQGPVINENAIGQLYAKLDNICDADVLVLAGSIPNSISDSVYEDILKRISHKNIKVVVDATGELLLNVLKYKPFLIKPNNFEMEEMFNTKITCEDELVDYGKKLQQMGARNVLISRAADGAILLTEDGNVYVEPALTGKVVNSVGAGDSMVAGFVAGILEKNNMQYALRLGICAGSASAFSENLATKDEIWKLMNN